MGPSLGTWLLLSYALLAVFGAGIAMGYVLGKSPGRSTSVQREGTRGTRASHPPSKDEKGDR